VKERALEIVAARPVAASGVNLLREYVQSRILGQMQESGAFVSLAFMGGTALRFLYRIPRFSEDLDFTLEHRARDFDFADLTQRIERGLAREGYSLRARLNDTTVVARAMFGFAELLADAGLSPHISEVLWVRLELDTCPPGGAGLSTTMIDRFGPLRIQHHDLPSLFAGKLAAVLAREYSKGRDYYDLMWHLSRSPDAEPNLQLLRHALEQTAPGLADEAGIDWRALLRTHLEGVEWGDVRRDVAPFLEQARDLELLEPGTFRQLLG